jgi:hypothetical protein
LWFADHPEPGVTKALERGVVVQGPQALAGPDARPVDPWVGAPDVRQRRAQVAPEHLLVARGAAVGRLQPPGAPGELADGGVGPVGQGGAVVPGRLTLPVLRVTTPRGRTLPPPAATVPRDFQRARRRRRAGGFAPPGPPAPPAGAGRQGAHDWAGEAEGRRRGGAGRGRGAKGGGAALRRFRRRGGGQAIKPGGAPPRVGGLGVIVPPEAFSHPGDGHRVSKCP